VVNIVHSLVLLFGHHTHSTDNWKKKTEWSAAVRLWLGMSDVPVGMSDVPIAITSVQNGFTFVNMTGYAHSTYQTSVKHSIISSCCSTAPWGPRPPHFSRLHDHTL
jgi:hypothetical protein